MVRAPLFRWIGSGRTAGRAPLRMRWINPYGGEVRFAAKTVETDSETKIGVTAMNEAEPALEAMQAEYEAGKMAYQAELGLKRRLRAALKGQAGTEFDGRQHDLVAPLYVVSVASIQTPTPLWETETVRWIDGETDLAEYLLATEDGGNKLRCVRSVMETDLLEKAQSELRRNHLTAAARILTGADHDMVTYLRGVKSWMVVRWFYHVPCIDTNVHAAIEPVLEANLEDRPIHHPDMSEGAKGQARAKNDENGGRVRASTKKFIQERIGRYGNHDELRGIWEIVDAAMAESDGVRVPREILAQVAFNVGGQIENVGWSRTTHAPIYEAVGRNLSEFEA